MRLSRGLLAVVLSVLLPASACAAPADGAVVVFAASSLTDVVDRLTDEYQRTRGGPAFQVNLGSSAQLVQQLRSGAPADLVITADSEAMAELREGRHVAQPETVARNMIVLAVAPGNPAGINTLADIAAPGVQTALCAESVPCGRAAARVLQDAGIVPVAPSREDNVRSVLGKVSVGQVDAGFVYRTDVTTARSRGVTYLELPGARPNSYPAALTNRGTDRDRARDFFSWLTGPEAARIFRAEGFLPGTAMSKSTTMPKRTTMPKGPNA